MSSSAVADRPSTSSGLRPGALTTLGIVFLVLSAASPLIGLTGAVPTAIVLGNGAAAPMAYVATGLILLLFSVGYVAFARQVTNAGAMYAYVGRGLGVPMGLGAAVVAIWAYTCVQVAVYGFFGVVAAGSVAEWTGLEIPWWVLTLALAALVQVFGYLGISIGVRVLAVLLVLEWGTMVVLAAAIAVQGGAGEGFGWSEVFAPTAWVAGAPGVALVFAFASMFGFESSALYGEEARDPKRSVPRATVLSVVLITLFFLVTSWMLVVAYGPADVIAAAGATLESGNPAAFVFDAGDTYLGPWAPDLMSIFVLTSMFACTLAFHNGIARYLFSLGRDRALPERLAATNRHGAPAVASVAQTMSVVVIIVAFVLAGSDPVTTLFFWGSGIAVVGIVGLYILTAAACMAFFARNPGLDARRWNTFVAPALSILALGAALVLILDNFTVLVGGSDGLAAGLAATTALALVVGVALGAAGRNRLSRDALSDHAPQRANDPTGP